MDVVIDTNVLLISLPVKSPYRPIFDGLINVDFSLRVSNDRHFNMLKQIEFPKVEVLTDDEFLSEIKIKNG